jgi:hypothetical protein
MAGFYDPAIYFFTIKSVRTIQIFEVLRRDIRILTHDIPVYFTKGGEDEGTENSPN